MRKSKPVVIFIAIQLIIEIILANPAEAYFIRKFGTEYTFAVQEAYLTGDFVNYIEANGYVDCRFEFDRFEYHPENYAVISTDENGISYISSITDTPPESGDWLGTKSKDFNYYYHFTTDKIDYENFENSALNSDLFDHYEFADKYEITLNVSVFNGKAVLNEFLVDGVEINEYIKTQSEAK